MVHSSTSGAPSRKQRREAILLVLVSSLFVLAGAVMWVVAGAAIGLVSVVFFGACFLAGVMQLVQPGSPRVAGWIGVIAALLMGAGCGMLMLAILTGEFDGSPGRSPLLGVIVGGIGLVFFGGGGLLLLLRMLGGHRP